MDNALKYTQNGTVSIRAKTVFDKAAICIADTGKGILPKVIKELKQLFSQDFAAHIERRTGIGMSLIHYLVRQHQGHISFSTSPDGTVFS